MYRFITNAERQTCEPYPADQPADITLFPVEQISLFDPYQRIPPKQMSADVCAGKIPVTVVANPGK